MENSKSLIIRLAIILGIIAVFIAMSAYFLADLQITNYEYYTERSENSLSANTTVYAARGEIVDRNGVPLVSNKTSFLIRFESATWDSENQNQVILKLIKMLEDNYSTYQKSLPIILTNDTYSFSENIESLSSYFGNRGLSDDLTADEVMLYLINRYQISADYNKSDALKIATVRYQMETKNFSTFNSFTFAEDIPITVVTEIKERSLEFPGVFIDEKPIREYMTPYAAHILGRVGAIQNYADYKDLGYSYDATVGIDGMEKVLEEYLKPTNGKKASDLLINGELISSGESVPAISGNNAVLTIDIALQQVAEESLARTLEAIKEEAILKDKDGQDIEGGAVVVLDVNTGEVLALASYPTYDLSSFNQNYNNLVSDPLKPMLNRAISGAYAPGSTFKMVPAIAALEEGVVTPDTLIRCQGVYNFYASSGYTPKCWIYRSYGATHGNLNVTGALKNSCNYYFYEIGRLLTAPLIEEYAQKLGLGSKTGIELSGEEKGIIAGPSYRDSIGMTWYPGDTLSAAIGQSDHLYTPIQIANYIATLTNGGTVNQVHLTKSIESFDYSETILVNDPAPLLQTDFNDENLQAVLDGMGDVVNEGGTAASIFRNYPIQVAGKTGSAQVNTGSAHGLFASFAPFDNPEIAVCVVGEHAGSGGNVASIARDIYDAYFNTAELYAQENE